MKKQIINKI